ncbi:MAG TPA: YdcF family protein [Flavobacteriales bacterium]
MRKWWWCARTMGRKLGVFGLGMLRRTCLFLGGATLVLMILACTRVPYDVHRWLGTGAGLLESAPDRILVLGGSGMPSGPELLRLHYAAALAKEFPEARILLVHPEDTAILAAMELELRLRGVAPHRIGQEDEGTSTRAQALAAFAHQPALRTESIALVTAPENMYRSVRTFRRVGCTRVAGVPAFDTPMFVDLAYDHRGVGGRVFVPDVSERSGLRYTFWNYLKLEITCLREFFAISYYRLNGWL